MIDIVSSEMTKFNTSTPPSDFILKNAWEIRERLPVNISRTIPSIPPQLDVITRYNSVSGESRYIVEEIPNIGIGGVSNVYRAWDKRLGKYVAVKEMHNINKYDSDLENFIELESKTLSKLNHPGIPEVYDLTVAITPDRENSPVMIMQLIDAKDLHTKLNVGNQFLTLDEISKIVTQTASTVDYMNKMGVVHTEIKPKNILLAEPHVKIIDFGSSNWVDKQEATYTKIYSAPEVMRREGKNDPRSDVYSLAATTFYMFFGEPPVEGYSDVTPDIFTNNTFRYRNLSELNKIKLQEVLKKGLEKKPENRFQTSSEFATALNEALKIKQ